MSDKLDQLGIKDSERTPCEIWTRVMGYHRPISSFNIGKQGEVAERKYFSEKNAETNLTASYRERLLRNFRLKSKVVCPIVGYLHEAV